MLLGQQVRRTFHVHEARLTDTVRSLLTAPLHAYWQYSQLPQEKLEHPSLLNPADTFEQFLVYSTRQLERISNELPHRVELGVFSVQLTRVKGVLGQRLAGVLEGFKGRLPELVEERTGRLNEWLGSYGSRLREEILNIDDYVRTVGNIREIEGQFGDYREECNELAQVYQTMQQFRIDTRRRKDFETVTLKLKDQLDQLLLAAEHVIPDLHRHLTFRSIGTPITNDHYCESFQGAAYGTAKTPWQLGPFSFPIRTRIDGLFQCGASTISHGVGGASMSGLLAAKEILGLRTALDCLGPADGSLRVMPSESAAPAPDLPEAADAGEAGFAL